MTIVPTTFIGSEINNKTILFVQDEPCAFQRSKIRAKVSGMRRVKQTEDALQAAVATVGPISVAVVVTDKFKHYKGANTTVERKIPNRRPTN